jgi:hypothetical protein
MIEPADNVDSHESANEERCLDAAVAHGLLDRGIDPIRDGCDDAEYGCPLCPWVVPIPSPNEAL